jgi:hypothetical protein
MIRHALTNRLGVAAILLSLLFSVGEGMRLNPFGFTTLGESPKSLARSDQNSKTIYGPLDVPAQVGSRNKRAFLEFDVPSFIKTIEPQTQISIASSAESFSIDLAPSAVLQLRGPPALNS